MTIRLDRLSAASTDIVEMMEAVPDLVNIVRYGDVRNLISARWATCSGPWWHVSLQEVCSSASTSTEEAAGELLEHLSATNYAVSTLDDEELNGMWYGFVQQIRNSSRSASAALRVRGTHTLRQGQDIA